MWSQSRCAPGCGGARIRWITVSLIAAAALAACGATSGDDDAPGGDGARFTITVAPLEAAGIDVACYDIAVTGAEGVVETRGDPVLSAIDGDAETVCSDRFGVGPSGDITYISTCDAADAADVDASRDGVQNHVTIWVDGLYQDDDGARAPVADWQNPCAGAGCRAVFDCERNADNHAAFDLTILRQSATGFFDILVDFEDIYCAAKVDCRQLNATAETDDDPVIRLINGADDGVKLPTVVFALACSAGPGDDNTTHLYLSDVAIDCEGAEHDLVVPVDAPDRVFSEDPTGVVAQAFVFQGEDNLSAEDRLYWNVAVGLLPADDSDPLAPVFDALDCVLRASGTASSGPLDDAIAAAGAFVTYPYIRAEVPLTDAAGALVCTRHPVNGGAEVTTAYGELGQLPPEIIWEMSMTGDGNVTVTPFTQ